MVFKDIATLFGYGVELVITQIRKYSTRDAKGIVELIVGIVHLIYSEHILFILPANAKSWQRFVEYLFFSVAKLRKVERKTKKLFLFLSRPSNFGEAKVTKKIC